MPGGGIVPASPAVRQILSETGRLAFTVGLRRRMAAEAATMFAVWSSDGATT